MKKSNHRRSSQITATNDCENFCAKYREIQQHATAIDDYSLKNVTGGTELKRRFTAAILALLPMLPNVQAAGGKGKNSKINNPPQRAASSGLPNMWADDLANERLSAIIDSVKNNRSADVNSDYSQKHRTPLMYAASKSNVDIVEKLLKRGAEINAKDTDGWTPLMFAISRDNPSDKMEIIEKLLAHGADINLPDNQGKTAMDLAFEAKNVQIANSILRNYAARRGLEVTSGNLLLDTIQEKNYSFVRALLKIPRMDITAKNVNGQTALMLAVEDGQAEIIGEILAKDNTIINETNKDGFTALMLATLKGDAKAVSLLLQSPIVNLDIADKRGRTALTIAIQKNHAGIIRQLLTKNVFRANECGKNGLTPLMVAIKEGSPDVVSAFIESRGVDINAKDKFGKTPLMFAVQSGKVDIVKKLLEERPDININAVDKAGWSALMFAAYYGNTAILEDLIKHGAKVDIEDKDHCTPLMIATWSGVDDVIKKLLDQEAIARTEQRDVPLIDSYGGALKFALSKKRFDFANEILARGLSNGIDKPLYAIVKSTLISTLINDNFERANEILENIGNLNIDVNEPIGGADEYKDKTLLMLATSKDEAIANKLLDKVENCSENIDTQDECGRTALMLAAEHGHFHLAERILNMGAKFDMANSYDQTALTFANLSQNPELIKLLLDKYKSAYTGTEDMLKNASPEVCQALLTSDEDAKKWFRENKDLQYDFMKYWVTKCPDLLAALFSANIINIGSKPEAGMPFLLRAVNDENEDLLRALSLCHANADLRDDFGNTALICALKRGREDIFENVLGLVNDESTIVSPNNAGETALSVALSSQNHTAAQKLLEKYRELNGSLESPKLLEVASEKGHIDLFKFLLNNESLTCDKETFLDSALLSAINTDQPELLTEVLRKCQEFGKAINIPYANMGNNTPLMYALKNDKSDAVRAILENDFELDPGINTADPSGYTPLAWVITTFEGTSPLDIFSPEKRLAGMHTKLEDIETILKNGSKWGLEINNEQIANNAGSYTPLVYASLRGYTDVVRLIFQYGKVLNLDMKINAETLSYAAFKNDADSVNLILDYEHLDTQSYINALALVAMQASYKKDPESFKKVRDIMDNILKHIQEIDLDSIAYGMDPAEFLIFVEQNWGHSVFMAIILNAMGGSIDVNLKTYNLMYALKNKRFDIAQAILQSDSGVKPNVNIKDADGNTPLLLAIHTFKEEGCREALQIIEYIIENKDKLGVSRQNIIETLNYASNVVGGAYIAGLILDRTDLSADDCRGALANTLQNGAKVKSPWLREQYSEIITKILEKGKFFVPKAVAENVNIPELLMFATMIWGVDSTFALLNSENDPPTVENYYTYALMFALKNGQLQAFNNMLENDEIKHINLNAIINGENLLQMAIKTLAKQSAVDTAPLMPNMIDRILSKVENGSLCANSYVMATLTDIFSSPYPNFMPRFLDKIGKPGVHYAQQEEPINLAFATAAYYGRSDIVEKMLEKKNMLGLNPGAQIPEHNFQTALIFAARAGQSGVISTLLEKCDPYSINIDAKDTACGETALDWAISYGHIEIAQQILRKKHEWGMNPIDELHTAFNAAYERGDCQAMENLMETYGKFGIKPEINQEKFDQIFRYAVREKKVSLAIRIIENTEKSGLNICPLTDEKAKLLISAIEAGNTELATSIITCPSARIPNPSANCTKQDSTRDLIEAVCQGNEALAQDILRNNKVDINAIYQLSKRSVRILPFAIDKKLNNLATEIIDHSETLGLDINAKNDSGHTALSTALFHSNFNIAKKIIDDAERLHLDINQEDNYGTCPLLLAILKGQGDIALRILEKAEELGLNCVKMDGESVKRRQDCIESIRRNSRRKWAAMIIENIDELGIDVTKIIQIPKSIPMLFMYTGGDVSCALIDNAGKLGIDINQEFDGATILLNSIFRDNRKFASHIIEHAEALKLDINKQDSNGNTALLSAIERSGDEIALSILENAQKLGLDITATNKKGDSALTLAISKGKDQIALKISENPNLRIDSESKIGNQLFALALKAQNTSLALKTINDAERLGMDINAIDEEGCSTLSAAINHKMEPVAIRIIERGTELHLDIGAVDKTGKTALQLAASNGQQSVVDAINRYYPQ